MVKTSENAFLLIERTNHFYQEHYKSKDIQRHIMSIHSLMQLTYSPPQFLKLIDKNK